MPDPGKEKRTAARYPLILPAEVTEVSTGVKFTARTGDVSRTGCYIDTLNSALQSSRVHLRLRRGEEVFETTARVAYISQGQGMGMAFTNVAPAQQAILDRWIADHNH